MYANDPGYGEVEPMGLTYVHLGAVPHVDTVERFSESDLRASGAASANGGATGNETARLAGGVRA